jgi:hypothetical protein
VLRHGGRHASQPLVRPALGDLQRLAATIQVVSTTVLVVSTTVQALSATLLFMPPWPRFPG